MSYQIEIANQQSALPVNSDRIDEVVRQIISDAGMERATISVAVVDDATIHELNRNYLQHDYPTDVLSFVLDRCDAFLEGEVIVSSETAISNSERFDQSAENELFLYVIHGVLHLVGYDDKNEEARQEMRLREKHYLQHYEVDHRVDF